MLMPVSDHVFATICGSCNKTKIEINNLLKTYSMFKIENVFYQLAVLILSTRKE